MATEAQAGYTAMAEEAWAAYTKGVAAWVDKAIEVGPGRFGSRRQRVQVDGFAATTAAFDQFQKASKQVVNLADASVRAAAANASKATVKGRKAA